MRPKETKSNPFPAPIHRAISPKTLPAPILPGEAGQAAVAAAARRELDRCACDIEQFLEASKMETLIDRIQADLDRDKPDVAPRMRLRRE